MARSKTPNALQMRELKYGEHSDEERERVARDLFAQGRRDEALLLFDNRPDHPLLRDEVRWAIEQGNVFHLQAVSRAGREVTAEELRACAQSAEAHGRWMDARNAYLQLEDEGAIRAMAEHLPESLRPAPEVEEPDVSDAGSV